MTELVEVLLFCLTVALILALTIGSLFGLWDLFKDIYKWRRDNGYGAKYGKHL